MLKIYIWLTSRKFDISFSRVFHNFFDWSLGAFPKIKIDIRQTASGVEKEEEEICLKAFFCFLHLALREVIAILFLHISHITHREGKKRSEMLQLIIEKDAIRRYKFWQFFRLLLKSFFFIIVMCWIGFKTALCWCERFDHLRSFQVSHADVNKTHRPIDVRKKSFEFFLQGN